MQAAEIHLGQFTSEGTLWERLRDNSNNKGETDELGLRWNQKLGISVNQSRRSKKKVY